LAARINKEGNQRLAIEDTYLDFDSASSNVTLIDLRVGATLFTERVRNFIEQNSDMVTVTFLLVLLSRPSSCQVVDAVKPQIKEQMTQVVERVLNNAVSKLPADDLIDILSLDERQSRRIRVQIN